MKKVTFDRHVANLYEDLKGIAEARYGEQGQDALHDAFVSIYSSKAYSRLHKRLGVKKVTGWLVQAMVFSVRHRRHAEATYNSRYTLLTPLDQESLASQVGMVDDYPIDVVHDVQVAIGSLSVYHQGLVYAHFYEGRTLREIAKRIDETFYRVFTEMEIAKACLRTQLEEYRR